MLKDKLISSAQVIGEHIDCCRECSKTPTSLCQSGITIMDYFYNTLYELMNNKGSPRKEKG